MPHSLPPAHSNLRGKTLSEISSIGSVGLKVSYHKFIFTDNFTRQIINNGYDVFLFTVIIQLFNFAGPIGNKYKSKVSLTCKVDRCYFRRFSWRSMTCNHNVIMKTIKTNSQSSKAMSTSSPVHIVWLQNACFRVRFFWILPYPLQLTTQWISFKGRKCLISDGQPCNEKEALSTTQLYSFATLRKNNTSNAKQMYLRL